MYHHQISEECHIAYKNCSQDVLEASKTLESTYLLYSNKHEVVKIICPTYSCKTGLNNQHFLYEVFGPKLCHCLSIFKVHLGGFINTFTGESKR